MFYFSTYKSVYSHHAGCSFSGGAHAGGLCMDITEDTQEGAGRGRSRADSTGLRRHRAPLYSHRITTRSEQGWPGPEHWVTGQKLGLD